MIWISSDFHMDHENIITKLTKWPDAHNTMDFDSVEEMNQTITDNVNAVVKENHTLYFLGDFCIPKLDFKKKIEAYIKHRATLDVKEIHLIRGNHDPKAKYDDILREIFTTVTDINQFKYNKRKFFLCHYAMRVWKNSQHGVIHCYGHSHGSLLEDPNSLSRDVGIDTHTEFRPYHVDEVLTYMGTKTYQPMDHHGRNKDIT